MATSLTVRSHAWSSRPSGQTKRSRSMVGTFEENILNNRLEPIRTVDGYMADVRASSNSKQPNPMRSGVRVNFYSLDGCFPYLGQVNLGLRGYKIPKKGTIQVTLFNPNGTIVKMFLLHHDLTDMPPNSQTFLRQKTVFQPVRSANTSAISDAPLHLDDQSMRSSTVRPILSEKTSKNHTPHPNKLSNAALDQTRSRIKYLIQLNIVSSKSGRIYLNKDLRIFVSKKADLETASEFSKQRYELKAFDEMPSNPKYFSR